MKAPVRKIIGQSTVDGPGNRTAVFLQGCNIHCVYCHNPETQAMHNPNVRGISDSEAKEMGVIEMTVEEVMEEVKKGIPFIRGITVSGGECMLHQDFVLALFRAVHALDPKLTCLIDSNGTIPFYKEGILGTAPLYEAAAAFDGACVGATSRPIQECPLQDSLTALARETDGVMLDVKAWNDSVWHSVTRHKSNAVVKQNLRTLLLADKLTEVRVVCLPKEGPVQTDAEAIIAGIRSVAEACGRPMPKVHLIAFRPHGVVGPMADAPTTPPQEMAAYEAMVTRRD